MEEQFPQPYMGLLIERLARECQVLSRNWSCIARVKFLTERRHKAFVPAACHSHRSAICRQVTQ